MKAFILGPLLGLSAYFVSDFYIMALLVVGLYILNARRDREPAHL